MSIVIIMDIFDIQVTTYIQYRQSDTSIVSSFSAVKVYSYCCPFDNFLFA